MAVTLPSPMRKPRFLTFAGGLLFASIALGNPILEPPVEEFDYDESLELPWIEEDTGIPQPPDVAELQFLDVKGLPPGLKLYLDTARVKVDPNDRVIRMWVYLRSSHGVDNGSYEGFRCSTGEYRIYGYATPQRKPPVTPAKRSAWRLAREEPGSRYRHFLMQGYLCRFRGPRSPDEIQRAVRAGQPRNSMLSR
ncbi:MAG: CNP1-like family protein [Chromatiaceae bacterium]